MVSLTAVYSRPDDPAAFDKHYFGTHLSLAKKMPGLIRCDVARCKGAPMPDADLPHLVAHLYFKDMETLKTSMASPEGKAAAKDVMSFAAKYVKMYFMELVEG